MIVASPGCGSISSKSIEAASTRGGVPVLKRRSEMPSFCSAPARCAEESSPCGPPIQLHSPMMMRLSMYTPEQMTTARQVMCAPVVVSRPQMRPSCVSSSPHSPWRTSRFGWAKSARFIRC